VTPFHILPNANFDSHFNPHLALGKVLILGPVYVYTDIQILYIHI